MAKISISIDVSDLRQATDFYTRALDCKKLRDQQPNMVVLAAENTEIYLLEKQSGTRPLTNTASTRSFERHWTPVHLDFAITDVQGAVTKVVESGGAHEGGEKGDWGEIAYCADPFGNGFCVIRE